jgi:hypothetical protein
VNLVEGFAIASLVKLIVIHPAIGSGMDIAKLQAFVSDVQWQMVVTALRHHFGLMTFDFDKRLNV